jgi:hypothetical protein
MEWKMMTGFICNQVYPIKNILDAVMPYMLDSICGRNFKGKSDRSMMRMMMVMEEMNLLDL